MTLERYRVGEHRRACLELFDGNVPGSFHPDERCTHIRLDTLPSTAPFFERFGFEAVSVEPNGYGPGMDRVEMRRTLRP